MSQDRFKAEIMPMREKLFHMAQRILVDEQEAEDAVQEVLLKLWHSRDSLANYESPAAYATTVLKNHCLDRLKVKNRQQLLDDSYNGLAAAANPYAQLERKNTEEVIQLIIKSLPALQQAIIRMKDIEEYEVDEIAGITGTNVEAVRVNLSRARKKVREEYLKWTKE